MIYFFLRPFNSSGEFSTWANGKGPGEIDNRGVTQTLTFTAELLTVDQTKCWLKADLSD